MDIVKMKISFLSRFQSILLPKRGEGDFFEIDQWAISKLVVDRLVPVVGIKPFPLPELQLMTSAVAYFQPSIIFEWGTHIGKSARTFVEIVRALSLPIKIVSIDLPDTIEHIEHPGNKRGLLVKGFDEVTLLQGDGVNTSLKQLKKMPSNTKPLFFLDGDHSYDTVKREINAIAQAAPMAPLMVHDTFFQSKEAKYNIGPFKATRWAIKKYGYEKIDITLGLPGMTLLYKGDAK